MLFQWQQATTSNLSRTGIVKYNLSTNAKVSLGDEKKSTLEQFEHKN